MVATPDDAELNGLLDHLDGVLPDEPVDAEVVQNGLNLSVAVSTSAGRTHIVRRPNKFRETKSFNDLRTEFTVLERLGPTSVPAPTPVHFCDDESILGDPFIVMSHLDGEIIPLGDDPPNRFRHPAARERIAAQLLANLGHIQAMTADHWSDVLERVPIDVQVARTIDRLEEVTAVTDHRPAVLWDLADWLRDTTPADAPVTFCHGDYRPSNTLFDGEQRPTLTGVLDWETAFLGDPSTEMGYLLLRWRDPGDPTPSLDDISVSCTDDVLADLQETNRRGLAPFTSRPGSPRRADLIERYERITGVPYHHDRFYRAFAAFMLATVWADLHRYEFQHGGSSKWPPYVEYMGLLGRTIAGC